MTESKKLEKMATKILRKGGFTRSGRHQRWVDPGQTAFERKLLINPVYSAR